MEAKQALFPSKHSVDTITWYEINYICTLIAWLHSSSPMHCHYLIGVMHVNGKQLLIKKMPIYVLIATTNYFICSKLVLIIKSRNNRRIIVSIQN